MEFVNSLAFHEYMIFIVSVKTLSMIAPDSLDLEDFLDEDYPTREELETWKKSDLIDFILGEDIEEDSENGVIPVDVTLSCTPTEEDVYGAY